VGIKVLFFYQCPLTQVNDLAAAPVHDMITGLIPGLWGLNRRLTMSTKDMTERNGEPARRGLLAHSLTDLHKEVDRLFDDFVSDFRPWRSGISLWSDANGDLVPQVDVSETDKEIQVKADLPGIDEKDIEVTLADGVLTIKGERKEEKEEKDEKKSFHKIERSYGMYSRSIALPSEVEEDKIEADFAKGVLTIKMPKSANAKSKVKKISVKGS
jgi:HSP20 family protein